MISSKFNEVLKSFKMSNHIMIKQNLKTEIKKIGTRKEVANMVGMDLSFFQNCLNPSHKNSLSFENLILICGELKIDISNIFKQVEIKVGNQGAGKKWNNENKIKLVELSKRAGVNGVMEKYNLSQKTSEYYIQKFKNDLNC